jgi:hypothetical protein
MRQQYKVDFLTVVQDGGVKSDCGDITFINYGISVVTINATVNLLQNQSITFSANENEIDKTIYYVKFSGIFNKLAVLRKIYT